MTARFPRKSRHEFHLLKPRESWSVPDSGALSTIFRKDMVQMSEIKPDDIKQNQFIMSVSGQGTVTDPRDFSEGGGEHRKGIIASTSLIAVLVSSTELKPVLLGIIVSVPVLWILIGISHLYFFAMWRITAPIEADSEKHFWNIRGLYKQAFLGGTKGFPGKTKAQLFLIRALPIWAFIAGVFGVFYGLYRHVCA